MEAGRINKNPNPWSIVPHLRGLVFQLVKKRPVFFATWMFITAFAEAWHLSLSWARSIQSICAMDLFKIHFSITLPARSRSPKWHLSLRFPHQNPVCISSLPYVLHALFPHYFLFIICTIPSEGCQSRRSVFCHLQSPVMSSHLLPT